MLWFFLPLLFILVIVFGIEIVKDSGYALFVYHDWSVQMPLWFALLLLFSLLIIVYFVTRTFSRLFFLKKSLRLWWLERCFHKKKTENKK